MNNSFQNQKIISKTVDSSCRSNIKTIFKTLHLQKKCKQQDLADYLNVDKAYVSRMVHGFQIPPLRIRLKVAEFFSVDSCLIWRNEKSKEIEQEFNDIINNVKVKFGGLDNEKNNP